MDLRRSTVRTASVLVALLAHGAFATACCRDGVPDPWKPYDRGVQWLRTLDAARKRALQQNRPILYHVLVGDMDKEGT